MADQTKTFAETVLQNQFGKAAAEHATDFKTPITDAVSDAVSELAGCKLARPAAHTALYIVVVETYHLTALVHPANRQVNVTVMGVRVNCRNPFVLAASVLVHLSRQVDRKLFQI